MITLTLWSSNELRVDHKLVKAESQTQFDFNDKNEWKERKNTYKRSPQALDPIYSQVWSINFNLESQNQIQVCFGSEMGLGIYRNSSTVKIVRRKMCFDLDLTCGHMVFKTMGILKTIKWYCKTRIKTIHVWHIVLKYHGCLKKWTKFNVSTRIFKNGPCTCKTWFFWHF